jgi:hypothetical protein
MFAFSGRSGAAGHKKSRKKKSIPVAPPKLPSFDSSLLSHTTSSNNGLDSPSGSSFPKLLNVHADGSGKNIGLTVASLSDILLSHIFLSSSSRISHFPTSVSHEYTNCCQALQPSVIRLARKKRSLTVISGVETVTCRLSV